MPLTFNVVEDDVSYEVLRGPANIGHVKRDPEHPGQWWAYFSVSGRRLSAHHQHRLDLMETLE